MLLSRKFVRTYLSPQTRTANSGANTGSATAVGGNSGQVAPIALNQQLFEVQKSLRESAKDDNLHRIGGAHHILLPDRPVGRSRVPATWNHDTVATEAQYNTEPVVAPSKGIVASYVGKVTRQIVLDDLAKTMFEAQKDTIDEIGEVRVSRSLYERFALWAERKFVCTKAQKRFRMRLLYRFETTSELVSLFKILNPRPFGLKKEARLAIVGEFGKMMKEIRRLHLADTFSETIPENIISMYRRVMQGDNKFHDWVCIVGPALVAVRGDTHALADKVWELAVCEAEKAGQEW